MKKYLLLIFTALLLPACVDNTQQTTAPQEAKHIQATKPQASAETWNGSDLSEATIKKVQAVKYEYTQCVYTEAQKKGYQKIDTRVATDAVIKQCEPDLAKIRDAFVNDGVPGVIADRFLRKTRTEVTRKILKSLMFAEAARKAGATQ